MHFLRPGSAVLILTGLHNTKPHVWFLLTEPDENDKVLVVMLRTRRRHTDNTCILAPGEYSFGDQEVEGAIDYGAARLFPVTKLVEGIRQNRIKMREQLSPELFARVRDGCRVSGHTPNWVLTYLDQQGGEATNPTPL